MTQPQLEIIILAAGKGSRIKSSLPKVMHPLAGKPMLGHVLQTACALSPDRIHIVIGFGGEYIRSQFPSSELLGIPLNWVEQPELLGTGDAVKRVLPFLEKKSTVLVLYGDVPLITVTPLEALKTGAELAGLGLLTVCLDEPKGYGRVVRTEAGTIDKIVEDKDATVQQREINEVNTGFMAFQSDKLHGWLSRLNNHNAQQEYYLTDVVEMAVSEGISVSTVHPASEQEVFGVNDRLQLAVLERAVQKKQAETLMQAGVTLQDPERFDLRGKATMGQDVVIDVGVVFEGEVVIGDGVTIGPYSLIKDSTIEAGAVVAAHSIIDEAYIGEQCHVGPFARLRPGARMIKGSRIGNFVEMKNSTLGAASKVNHLSYIGDSSLGSEVNIGAGTITCNYDGVNKHRTVIGDHVFIGSCTQLVAPVTIGDGATVGAGSTITKDVSAGTLALSRSPQQVKKGWKRPARKK